MKKTILFLSFVVALLSGATASGQDVALNILSIPASIHVGDSGVIQVDICNTDGGSAPVPRYKLRPLISGNTKIQFVSADLPPGWAILSNDGMNMRLSNGSDSTLFPLECRQINIHFVGVNITNGSPDAIVSSMFFSDGNAPGNAVGPATVGDNPANNNSATAIEVIAPLPVKLLSFEAKAAGSQSVLNWTTVSERNNKGFNIERSADSKAWTTIGHVGTLAPNGNSTGLIDYITYDRQPLKGLNIYRLKQMDADGTATYSENRQVFFGNDGNTVTIFPNPVTEKVHIAATDWSRVAAVRLMDMNGRVLWYQTPATPEVDMQPYAKGLYLLQVIHTDQAISGFKITRQ